VVRARPVCVTSVDAMIEGVHFRLADGWASPAEVGHRAMAGALSDLAAMGAEAGEAYLVLGLPHDFSGRRRRWRAAARRRSQAGMWWRRRCSPWPSQASGGPSAPRSSWGATARARGGS